MKLADIDCGSFLTGDQNGMARQVVNHRSGDNMVLIIGRLVLAGKIAINKKSAGKEQGDDYKGQEGFQEAVVLFRLRSDRFAQRTGQVPGTCSLAVAISTGKNGIVSMTVHEGAVFIHKTDAMPYFRLFPACFFIERHRLYTHSGSWRFHAAHPPGIFRRILFSDDHFRFRAGGG